MGQLRTAIGTRTLVALVVVAALLRAIFLIGDPHPHELGGLSAGHGEVARNIVDHGEWFVVDKRAVRRVTRLQARTETLIDPASFDYSRFDADPNRVPEMIEPHGPSVILAGLWAVTGDERYIWLQLVQLVVGAALTLLVAWLALALFERPRAAIAAAGLWALSPTLSYFGVIPLYEIWAVFATLAIFAGYVAIRRRGSPAGALLAIGVAIGLGTHFRQGLVLLAPALALAELGVSWRPALRTGAILALGCVIGLIPWTVRNLHEFGELRPVNGINGHVLWVRLSEDQETFGAVDSDIGTLREVQADRPELEYGTPAYDSYLQSKALAAIADHPLAYGELLVRRSLNAGLLNESPWPRWALHSWHARDSGPVSFAVEHPLAAVALAFAALLDPLLFVGAVVVSVLLWPCRRQKLLLIWLAWASVMVVPVFVAGAQSRYVLPGLPLLMILCGVGIDMLITRVRCGRRLPRAAG